MVETICLCEKCNEIGVFENLKCSNCGRLNNIRDYRKNKISVEEMKNCGPLIVKYEKERCFRTFFNTLKEKGVKIKVE